jgi:hypothetical protein
MTGFMIKPRRDRVEIATDGAVYDANGVLLDTTYKVRVADNLPLAVVGSGTVAHIDVVADAILAAAAATGSVDATIELLAVSLQAIAAGAAFDSPVRIVIAAISETSGPSCWLFDTYDADGPAFELREAPFGIGQGELPPVEDMLARGIETGDSLDKHAVFFFDYMRGRKRVSPVSPEKGPIHNIGGHVDFTVLRADGVETKRLCTWPDVVGQKIEPSPKSRIAEDGDFIIVNGVRIRRGEHLTYDVEAGRIGIKS